MAWGTIQDESLEESKYREEVKKKLTGHNSVVALWPPTSPGLTGTLTCRH